MTTYQFETMSQTDADAFVSADTLIFTTPALTPASVSVSNGTLDGLTLTVGTKTLTFSGAQLSVASDADRILFNSSFNAGTDTTLVLGHQGGDNLSIGNDDGGNYAYGFSGNDSIVGGDGADVIDGGTGDDFLTGANGADNLFGGAGLDLIDGGSGNDHIYGFGLSGGDPATDGADTLNGDDGNDYVQGNGGNDLIDGGIGNDRLNGGANNDSITGGDGNDSVNGNKGNDVISGDDGNDSLRGGQDNDVLNGGAGNDILLGDLGNDSIHGDGGLDLLTGGDGEDQFYFTGADAGFTTTGSLAYFTDTITDFHAGGTGAHATGDDYLTIANQTTVVHQDPGVTVTTVSAAASYAQTLLSSTTTFTEVAAINVGSDTYLFYNSSGTADTIDSSIKLSGVSAANITFAGDFHA